MNTLSNRRLLIGITGGIGSGKSTIATMLKAMGYPVFSADACSSHLTDSDETVRKALSDLLGSEIFAPDGTLDKKRMSEIIFNNPSTREAVNGIIHPAVWHSFEAWCEECMSYRNKKGHSCNAVVSACESKSESKSESKRGSESESESERESESESGSLPYLLFLESAIIFECGWGDRFDYTICVTANEETRIQRAVTRSKGQNSCSAPALGETEASTSYPATSGVSEDYVQNSGLPHTSNSGRQNSGLPYISQCGGQRSGLPRISQSGGQREEQSPLTAEEVQRRIQNQMPDAEKIRLATYTIHTDDDQSELSQLLAILHSLRSQLH